MLKGLSRVHGPTAVQQGCRALVTRVEEQVSGGGGHPHPTACGIRHPQSLRYLCYTPGMRERGTLRLLELSRELCLELTEEVGLGSRRHGRFVSSCRCVLAAGFIEKLRSPQTHGLIPPERSLIHAHLAQGHWDWLGTTTATTHRTRVR